MIWTIPDAMKWADVSKGLNLISDIFEISCEGRRSSEYRGIKKYLH
jgi:hypothetical protein